MTLRLRSQAAGARASALEHEIVQERAAALGRLGRALEAALAALQDHEREGAGAADKPSAPENSRRAAARAELVRNASHALWCLMVQRESCGLRDPRPVIRDYRVPAEVYNRMGALGRAGPPASGRS